LKIIFSKGEKNP